MIKQTKCSKKISRIVIIVMAVLFVCSGCGASSDTGASMDTADSMEPVVPAESTIFVQKVDGISPDFIRGMDISSLLAEEDSGVKYYDAADKEADLFKIMSDAGINSIRVRVWNDPFDANHNGYGGGNCTAETAAVLGSRAAAYDMTTCVDFHYSDFWADPNKQMCPKAWEGMNLTEKKEALYTYTKDSLQQIIDAGASVSMVQIGNEINNGMAGQTAFGDVAELLKAGSRAVREVSDENDTAIKVVVHYTQIDNPVGTLDIVGKLAKYKVDYDVFGVSYYPFWHGSMTNMKKVLTDIHDKFGVDTCIMETSYMYTAADGDTSGNSVSADSALPDYPISVQGQANCVRDVCAYANEAGALGVFYWEGAWIPVNPSEGSRSAVWEKYGSGWASSYASEYDPKDAGQFYGGSSWDNQAFFDFEGHVLDSLYLFRYLESGVKGDTLQLIRVDDVNLAFVPDSEIIMPEKIKGVYNDSTCKDELSVSWDEEAIDAIDMSVTGEYIVDGVIEVPASSGIELSEAVSRDEQGNIRIKANITVANLNQLKNGSFEEEDTSMWVVTPIAGGDPSDIQNKSADAKEGDFSFHFWSQNEMEFTLEQTVSVDMSGNYTASAFMQGGDFNPDAVIFLYVKNETTGEEYKSGEVKFDGWCKWKNPTIMDITAAAGDQITVGAYVKCDSLAWATFDDFTLCMK